MKVLGVVQARMSSRRFPGKVLHEVGDKPVLAYLLERLQRCDRLAGVVVAISDDVSDDPVESFCTDTSTAFFRGPLHDVAERFIQLFSQFPADAYARISADSPMLDQTVVDAVVCLFEQMDPDLATNTFPRSFPKGQSVEVFSPQVFQRACKCFEEPEDFEHITRYFYRHENVFEITNLTSDFPSSAAVLCIDVPEQLEAFAALLERMERPHWTYGWKEILALRGGLEVAQ